MTKISYDSSRRDNRIIDSLVRERDSISRILNQADLSQVNQSIQILNEKLEKINTKSWKSHEFVGKSHMKVTGCHEKNFSEKIYKYIFFIGALHDLLGGSWVIMRDYTAS